MRRNKRTEHTCQSFCLASLRTIFQFAFMRPDKKLKAHISKLWLGNTDNLFQFAFMHPDKSSKRTSKSFCLATLRTFFNLFSCTATKAQSIHLKAVARHHWHPFPVCFHARRQKLKVYMSLLLLGSTKNLFQFVFMHPDKSSKRTSPSYCLATFRSFANLLSCAPTKAQSVHLKTIAWQH